MLHAVRGTRSRRALPGVSTQRHTDRLQLDVRAPTQGLNDLAEAQAEANQDSIPGKAVVFNIRVGSKDIGPL